MHAKNALMIADLKKQGIDTTELEKVLNASPAIDNYYGQGITRTQEFTTIINDKRKLEAQFQHAQAELAAMQNQLKSGGLNPATVTAIDTRMKALKQFLIDEEYPESQVNDLFKDIEGNIAASQTVPNSPSNVQPQASAQQSQQKGVAMTDEERTALRNESAAVGAALGVGLNFNIQKAMAEFNSVYGRFPNEQEIANLESAVSTRHIQGGEPLNSVIDETFKISTQRAANAETARQREIADAKAAGRAEAFQEAGIIPGGRPQGGRVSRAPVFARANNNVPANSASVPPPANNVPPPAASVVNSPDTNASLRDSSGLLPFQQRGNKQTRMNHLATVAAENPDLFQNDGYQPRYGRDSQQ